MPVRSNPYVSGGATFGSRGLGAGTAVRGGVNIATPLAQLVTGAMDSATYDPAYDAQGQAARVNKLKADQAENRSIVARQIAPSLADTTVPLADIAANATGYGGFEPEDAAKMMLLAQAARGRPQGQDMDAALSESGLMELAAGRAGGSTFNASTYGERKKLTPVLENGSPVLRAAENAAGATPVLSKEQVAGGILAQLASDAANPMSRDERLAAAGAEPAVHTPYNYIKADGTTGSTTDASSVAGPGTSIYSGTVQSATPGGLRPTVQSGLQENQLNLAGFDRTLATLESMSTDPTNFGVTGMAKDWASQGTSLMRNVGQLFGKDYSQIVADISNEAFTDATGQPVKIDLGQFDPRIHGLRSFAALAAYQGASALAKQEGRSVALAELENFKNIVGDPLSPLMDKQKFLSGMAMLRNEVKNRWTANESALKGKPIVPGGSLGDAAAAAVPGAEPAAAPKQRIRIDAQGNIIQ